MPDTLQPPRILIASHHAEAGLALKELGEKNGYTVVRCFTAVQALERARATRPDVIVLDESLVDADPLETRRALRAGVWEFLPHPFNPEEAAARLQSYVRHKREVERARREQAVQDEAGL